MYKKIIGAIVGVVIFSICSVGSFAELKIEFNDESSISLIEPNVGSENQIILRDSLTILIKPQDEPTVCVGLSKIMPSCIGDELNIFIREVCEEYEFVFEKEEILGDSQKVDVDLEVNLENNREQIISEFSKLKEEFEEKIVEFRKTHEDFKKKFPNGADELKYLKKENNELLIKYNKALNDIVNDINNFKKHEQIYVDLFETDLFEPELISPTGVLPYYQKTVENILPGYYRLEFYNEDSNEILEIVDFEIIDKELMTEENIKDVVDDYMKPLNKNLAIN